MDTDTEDLVMWLSLTDDATECRQCGSGSLDYFLWTNCPCCLPLLGYRCLLCDWREQ